MLDRPVAEGDSRLARLYAAQRDARERWALTVATAVVGLGLAWIHWAGLLVGGALVGLCWPTLRRAVVAGVGFAVVVLVATAAQFWAAGTLGKVLGATPLVYVAVAAPVVAGPLGATARGLLPDAPAQTGDGEAAERRVGSADSTPDGES